METRKATSAEESILEATLGLAACEMVKNGRVARKEKVQTLMRCTPLHRSQSWTRRKATIQVNWRWNGTTGPTTMNAVMGLLIRKQTAVSILKGFDGVVVVRLEHLQTAAKRDHRNIDRHVTMTIIIACAIDGIQPMFFVVQLFFSIVIVVLPVVARLLDLTDYVLTRQITSYQ